MIDDSVTCSGNSCLPTTSANGNISSNSSSCNNISTRYCANSVANDDAGAGVVNKVASSGTINSAFESNPYDTSEETRKVSSASCSSDSKQSRVAPVHSLLNRFRRSKSCCNDTHATKTQLTLPKEDSKKSDLWKLGKVFNRSASDNSFDSEPADQPNKISDHSSYPAISYDPSSSGSSVRQKEAHRFAMPKRNTLSRSKYHADIETSNLNDTNKFEDPLNNISQIHSNSGQSHRENRVDEISIIIENSQDSEFAADPSNLEGSHAFSSLPVIPYGSIKGYLDSKHTMISQEYPTNAGRINSSSRVTFDIEVLDASHEDPDCNNYQNGISIETNSSPTSQTVQNLPDCVSVDGVSESLPGCTSTGSPVVNDIT